MEASAKKHEAIETDILAYEERVLAVVAVAEELQTENYHDIERINARSAGHRRAERRGREGRGEGGKSGGECGRLETRGQLGLQIGRTRR